MLHEILIYVSLTASSSDYYTYFFWFKKLKDYYTGACLYLIDGYWEVDTSYYSNAYESIQYGFCVECNGKVGCSSDGTCDNFMSSVPQTSYQMTQDDGGGDDDDSEAAIAEESYAMASQMRKSTIDAFESNRASESTAGYVVLGAFVGCAAVAGLFTTLGGFSVIGEAGTISRVNVNTIILLSTRSRVNVNRTPLTIDEVKEAIIV